MKASVGTNTHRQIHRYRSSDSGVPPPRFWVGQRKPVPNLPVRGNGSVGPGNGTPRLAGWPGRSARPCSPQRFSRGTAGPRGPPPPLPPSAGEPGPAAVRKVRPPMLRLRRAPAPGPGPGGAGGAAAAAAMGLLNFTQEPVPEAVSGDMHNLNQLSAQVGAGGRPGSRGGPGGGGGRRQLRGGRSRPGRAAGRGAGPGRPRSRARSRPSRPRGQGPVKALQVPGPGVPAGPQPAPQGNRSFLVPGPGCGAQPGFRAFPRKGAPVGSCRAPVCLGGTAWRAGGDRHPDALRPCRPAARGLSACGSPARRHSPLGSRFGSQLKLPEEPRLVVAQLAGTWVTAR